MDWLGASGGQRAEQTAVETSLEGHDGHVGCARSLIVHRRGDLLSGEFNIWTTTLLTTLPHKRSLVCELVGVRSSLSSEDLVEALGSDLQDSSLEDLRPVVLREVAQSRSVDNGRSHLGCGSSSEKSWVAVSDRDRSNLSVNIEQYVSIEIRNVIAEAVLVVGHHVQRTRVKDLVKCNNRLFRFRTWDLSSNGGTHGLVGEVWLLNSIGDVGLESCGRAGIAGWRLRGHGSAEGWLAERCSHSWLQACC